MHPNDYPLSAALLLTLPSCGATASAALEAPLREGIKQAQERWPSLTLPAQRYLTHLGALLADGDAAASAEALQQELDKRCLVDLYLACACADGAEAAVAVFSREYLARVPQLIGRLNLSHAQVEDVQSTLAERLLVGPSGGMPRIASYQGQGNLLTFVRVTALRLGLNLLRGPLEVQNDEEDEVPAEQLVPPSAETTLLLRRYRDEFQAAVRTAFQGLDRDRRSMLQLYYIDRLNTRDIARMFQVHPSVASRRVAEARAHIGQEVRRLLRERLRIDDAQLQSLYQAMRSQLNLSICSALQEGPAKGTAGAAKPG